MNLFDRVYSLATENHGIVTSAGAEQLGVKRKDLHRWVKMGRLVRFGRGVYRATQYPSSEEDQYAIAVAEAGLSLCSGRERSFSQLTDGARTPFLLSSDLAPLAKVKDAYPKMLLARTRNPNADCDGIRILNIVEWLLTHEVVLCYNSANQPKIGGGVDYERI